MCLMFPMYLINETETVESRRRRKNIFILILPCVMLGWKMSSIYTVFMTLLNHEPVNLIM